MQGICVRQWRRHSCLCCFMQRVQVPGAMAHMGATSAWTFWCATRPCLAQQCRGRSDTTPQLHSSQCSPPVLALWVTCTSGLRVLRHPHFSHLRGLSLLALLAHEPQSTYCLRNYRRRWQHILGSMFTQDF